MTGRIALVTGAGGDLGRAIAHALAARGVAVWLVGRRMGALEDVAGDSDGDLRPLPADLTDDVSLAALRRHVEDGESRLDVLVHCAGTIAWGTVDEAPAEEFDAQYRANLRAPYALTRALLPLLRADGGGDVVFVNSTAALGPRPGVGQYAATKAALRSIADTLRAEVNAHGVRVLSVFPGRTATSLQARIHEHEGRDYAPERLMQPEDVAAMIATALELPRTAEITEIVMRPFLKPA